MPETQALAHALREVQTPSSRVALGLRSGVLTLGGHQRPCFRSVIGGGLLSKLRFCLGRPSLDLAPGDP